MKPEFKVKKNKPTGVTLLVKGDLLVSHSTEFKDRLAELILATNNGGVVISLKEVTALDVSAVQLIYAATQESLKGKNKISMIWPDSEVLNGLIDKTGIKQAL